VSGLADEPWPGWCAGALVAGGVGAVTAGILGQLAAPWGDGAPAVSPRAAVAAAALTALSLEVLRRGAPPVWRHEALALARLALQAALVVSLVGVGLALSTRGWVTAGEVAPLVDGPGLARLDVPRWFLLAGLVLMDALRTRGRDADQLDPAAMQASRRRASAWLARSRAVLARVLAPGEPVRGCGWRRPGARAPFPWLAEALMLLLGVLVALDLVGAARVYGPVWTRAHRVIPWLAALALWLTLRARQPLAWGLTGGTLAAAGALAFGPAPAPLAGALVFAGLVAGLAERRANPRERLVVMTDARQIELVAGPLFPARSVGVSGAPGAGAQWPSPYWSLDPALDVAFGCRRPGPPAEPSGRALAHVALLAALCVWLDMDVTHRFAVLWFDGLARLERPAPEQADALAVGDLLQPDDPVITALRARLARAGGDAATAARLDARVSELAGDRAATTGSVLGALRQEPVTSARRSPRPGGGRPGAPGAGR